MEFLRKIIIIIMMIYHSQKTRSLHSLKSTYITYILLVLVVSFSACGASQVTLVLSDMTAVILFSAFLALTNEIMNIVCCKRDFVWHSGTQQSALFIYKSWIFMREGDCTTILKKLYKNNGFIHIQHIYISIAAQSSFSWYTVDLLSSFFKNNLIFWFMPVAFIWPELVAQIPTHPYWQILILSVLKL